MDESVAQAEAELELVNEDNEIIVVDEESREASRKDVDIIFVVEDGVSVIVDKTQKTIQSEQGQSPKKGRKPKFPRKIPKPQSPSHASGNHLRQGKRAAAILETKLESSKPEKRRRTRNDVSTRRNLAVARRTDRTLQTLMRKRKPQKRRSGGKTKKRKSPKQRYKTKVPDEETLVFCDSCLIGFCSETSLNVHLLETHIDSVMNQSRLEGRNLYHDEEPLNIPYCQEIEDNIREHTEQINRGVDSQATKIEIYHTSFEPLETQNDGDRIGCDEVPTTESSVIQESNSGDERFDKGNTIGSQEGQDEGNPHQGQKFAFTEIVNEQNNNSAENDCSKDAKTLKTIYTCGECTRRFYRKLKLAKHIGMHLKEKLTRCPHCPKEFPGKQVLNTHIRSHLEDKPFKCDVCMKGFTVQSYLKRHIGMHAKKKSFKCSECDEEFNTKAGLRRHAKQHSRKRLHKCIACDKCFKTKKSFEEHILIHGDVRPYPCELCDKSFKQRNNLTHHMRSHSGVKPYQCSECDQAFVSRQTFRAHMARHSGIQPFSCKICNKMFYYSSSLLKHMPKHSDQKRFSCDVCGSSFYHRYHLQRHYLVHNKDSDENKTFKCNECQQQFNVESNLKQHIKLKHLKEKRFFCQKCGKGFLHNCYLRNHIKVHQKKDDIPSTFLSIIAPN